jgi:hypothetical protein
MIECSQSTVKPIDQNEYTESDFICLDDGDSIPQSGGEGPSLPPFSAETAAQKARLLGVIWGIRA